MEYRNKIENLPYLNFENRLSLIRSNKNSFIVELNGIEFQSERDYLNFHILLQSLFQRHQRSTLFSKI
jgi:hypothetical protein